MFQEGTQLADTVDGQKIQERGFSRVAGLELDNAELYVQTPKSKKPKWVDFITPVTSSGLPSILTAAASAVLVIEQEGRAFAFPFGYGRSVLNLDRLEPNFGLKVALNSVDPSKLRSIDKKIYEDMVVSSSISLSSQSDLSNFNLDTYSDILRQATGTPRDLEFASRVSGADSLTVNKEIGAAELPNFCAELKGAFELDTYKEEFGWIDNLQIVRDKETIKSLNGELLEDLKSKQGSRTHLALPENIDWQDIESFRIEGTNSTVFPELDLSEVLSALKPKLPALTIEKLKRRRVGVVYARSDEVDYRWTLYRCLVSEQEVGEHLYALIEGSWFRIQKSLVNEVNEYMDTIPPSATHLPQHRIGEIENEYNARLAATSPELLLLDRTTGAFKGESGSIELCDVFSTTGELIHVKRKSQSASLSHLFSQGQVSTSVLLGDAQYRKRMREKINVAAGDIDPSPWLSQLPENQDALRQIKYKVTYAIVPSNSYQDSRWLPFFSKLNLMAQAKSLRLMGVEVAVNRIPSERYG